MDEALLRTLTPAVIGILVRRGADFAAAEDAVQDAMVEALRVWPDDPPRDPKGWLVGGYELDLILARFDDRLHEPYRHGIAPLLMPVRRLLAADPVLGTVLSGAGPSILVIVHERHEREILEKLKGWAGMQAEPPSVLDVPVDVEGIKELGQPGRPPSEG